MPPRLPNTHYTPRESDKGDINVTLRRVQPGILSGKIGNSGRDHLTNLLLAPQIFFDIVESTTDSQLH
jgi:hypothetical protein